MMQDELIKHVMLAVIGLPVFAMVVQWLVIIYNKWRGSCAF